MSTKISYSKLNLKRNDAVQVVKCGDNEIEVKQYLPVEEKIRLIENVLNACISNENKFKNPIQVEILTNLEIIYAYTNISFTDKQKDDGFKILDALDSTGLLIEILSAIPKHEYEFILSSVDETVQNYFNYKNSAVGIVETISQDYSNLNLETETIKNNLGDPAVVPFLKDVMKTMG